MTTEMPFYAEAKLIDEFLDGSPREVCGFILDNWDIFPMRNISPEDNRFAMDDQELLNFYQRFGSRALGVYHSHPSGRREPSRVDLEYAPQGLRYWIITRWAILEWDINHDPPVLVSRSGPILASSDAASGAPDGH